MRFLNSITFIDLPIRKKFLIFSGGVLFWFVVMFLITVTTLVNINNKSGKIVTALLPQDRIAQDIAKELKTLRMEVTELTQNEDAGSAAHVIERSRARIAAINSSSSALGSDDGAGGLVRDQARRIPSAMADVAQKFSGFAQRKLANAAELGGDKNAPKKDPGELQASISQAITASDGLSAAVDQLGTVTTDQINSMVSYAMGLALFALLLAAGLQLLFTKWIANSIAEPVSSIIDQIQALGKGDVDLSNMISITSKDDIGMLSTEFNGLMESIHKMTIFKKVIEEDDSLEDVYSRLGKVFQDIGIGEYMIYDVPTGQNSMKPAYPLLLAQQEIACNPDILDNCGLCKAKKTGHTISSTTYPQMCKMFLREQGKEHVCIPIIVGGNTGAVVQFMFDKTGSGHDTVQTMHHKVLQASQYLKESQSVIEAKRLMGTLRESALNDSLTGLRNRRFLQEYTENIVAGALRRGKSTGLVMCDLDFFKQVNDTHGHAIGDAVLKETAAVIHKSLRASDILIRFGGEEFLAVLLDIGEGEALAIAEKIRQNVEQTKFKLAEGSLQKTISLGVSEFPTDTKMFWQAIKYADVALYKAKETGRNKVVRFTPEMWTGESF